MALDTLAQLDKYTAGGAGFPPGYPATSRTFYSPVDRPHEALRDLIAAAQHSVIVAMYGFDDDELAKIIRGKVDQPGVFVQLSLDSSQAAGTHEKALLSTSQFPATSIAVGQSERHRIMHLKVVIVDGLDTADGSTNWSGDAETKQDNQLTITRDPLLATIARARLDAIHDSMLMQMAAKAANLAAPARSSAAAVVTPAST